jgi:hypothetical protein
MKQYLLIIFSALTLIACETKTQSKSKSVLTDQSTQINISVDTLNIPIQGDLRNVAWFRNNFYALFETNRKNTSERFKKMIVFNKKGEVIEDVFLPKEIQDMVYCDLIVSNDSLYVKETQFEKSNLVLGEYVADFALTKRKDFPIFKDEAYNIYSVCKGEFGGTIYFQNKKTKKGYEAASTCPIVVNKIDSQYYVTNSNSVLKIQNAERLENSNLNFATHHGSQFTKGVEILFDTSSFDMDFYIATSFISNKKLLILYYDKQETYVGEIENKKMKPILKFPFKFSAYFSQQLYNGQQILICSFANDKKGILIIDDNHFNFYRLK